MLPNSTYLTTRQSVKAISEHERERLAQRQRQHFAAKSKAAHAPDEQTPGGLVTGRHTRGYLPHLKLAGATYFITFRLADSLPIEALHRIQQGKEAAVHQALQIPDAKTREEAVRRCQQDHHDELETLLDQSLGHCWLAKPDVAELVTSTLRRFEPERYSLRAWVLMPNHVHAVVRPMPSLPLSTILHSWKSYTAKAALTLLPESLDRTFWQRESYDHLCRDDADIAHCIQYTEHNPVQAGFCAAPEDWRWSSAART